MAPNSQSGLTSALKQVYYIHKGIVAELTAKNQVLLEECRKLRDKLKDCKDSPHKCQICSRFSQRIKLLKSQGKPKDQTNKEQPLEENIENIPLEFEEAHKKNEEVNDSGRKRASPSEKYLTALNGNMPVCDANKKRAHSESSSRNLGLTENGKRRKLEPPIASSRNKSVKIADKVDKRSTMSVKASSKQTLSDPLHVKILAPETEVTPHKTSRQSKSESFAMDRSFNVSDCEDTPSPRILFVPETLHVDTCHLPDHEDQGDDLSHNKQEDKSISFGEDDFIDLDCPFIDTLDSKKQTNQAKECGEGAHEIQTTQIKTLEAGVKQGAQNGKGNENDTKAHGTEDSADDLIILEDRQYGIRRMKSNKVKSSIVVSRKADFEDVSEKEKHQLAQAIQLSLQDARQTNSMNSQSGDKSSKFKIPESLAQRNVVRKTSLSKSRQVSQAHVSSVDLNSEKESNHFKNQSHQQVSQVYAPPQSPSFDPNGSLDPAAHLSQYLDTCVDTKPSIQKFKQSVASMDETIAPDMLITHQSVYSSTACEKKVVDHQGDPIPRSTKDSDMQSQHKSNQVFSETNPDALVGEKDKTARSPGSVSLKLNKSSRIKESRSSRNEDGIWQSESEACERLPGASDRFMAGMSLESEDEDEDEDNETIAPSPKQSQIRSEMQSFSIPCSSRSYKFGNKKGSMDSKDCQKGHSRSDGHEDNCSNKQSMPFDDDDDEILLMDNTLAEPRVNDEESVETLKDDTEREPVVKMGSIPANSEPLMEEMEDSFDRVPHAIHQEVAHIDVVRKRSERDKLEGFSCKQCHEYYKNSGLSDEELRLKMKACSRHKERYKRPDTPEHFWTLGIPDTAEMMDRQALKGQDPESPVAAEKRPRRKRQLEMKFK